ncbi:hypothetical protein ASPVEDRAFT_45384 [Aspergillus versicolor CBS 583.65]|uniref:Magnesium transporter n=1 Tax=Aspergillus versicolor CBS 583.65 TaxID=1036611 RepID=A0A1L9PX09_ASPVE|nr:uncharacterized protein ASPVEDRAFT_45384 [Aspergillus versicolor CBS 583.65]OJJ05956.1 hypothetical protein ASPVEDRAFT_45384 [Aspergillus versicolor CBS 583.65]
MSFYSPVKALTSLSGSLSRPCLSRATVCFRQPGVAYRPWDLLRNQTYATTGVGSYGSPILNEALADRSQRVHELSVQLSQRPMNGNASMQYTRFSDSADSSGRESASQVQSQTKLAIAEQYGLTTRDLRVFDLPSPGFPHILVRERAILVHLFDLRLLVECDHVLLFHVADKPVEAAAPRPNSDSDSDGSTTGTDSSVSQVFSHNLERKLLGSNGHVQPYELRVLEAAMASATSVLEAEYSLTAEEVSQVLRQTHQDAPFISDKEKEYESLIHTLLRLSRHLASIDQSARQVRTLTSEVLAEDEDMANMYLTDKARGRPHLSSDHQEVEYLFEAYFKASDTIVQETKRMMGNITRTEETIRAALSVRRNQIMVLEARIEILMLALAGGTLIAGWYGMNVVNGSEESSTAFGVIVVGSLVGVGLITWGGLRRLKRISKIRV